MQYTFVVGSLCVLAVTVFVVLFLRDIRVKPLTDAEAMNPVKALAEGKATTGHVLMSNHGRWDTEIIMEDMSLWRMSFLPYGPHKLELIHAEAPDCRYTPRNTFLVVDDPRAVNILKDAWMEATDQPQGGEYVTA